MTQSEYLNQLIASGNLGKALEKLNQLSQGTFQSDIAMMALCRYNRLNVLRMQGTVSHDNATIEENRLSANVRTILAELSKEIPAKMNEEV